MKRNLIYMLAMGFLGACGDGSSGNNNGSNNFNSSESYTYQLELNGCNTGKHTFSSKVAMCNGLKSQSLNDYCAVSLRENHFNLNNCSGTFVTEN